MHRARGGQVPPSTGQQRREELLARLDPRIAISGFPRSVMANTPLSDRPNTAAEGGNRATEGDRAEGGGVLGRAFAWDFFWHFAGILYLFVAVSGVKLTYFGGVLRLTNNIIRLILDFVRSSSINTTSLSRPFPSNKSREACTHTQQQ